MSERHSLTVVRKVERIAPWAAEASDAKRKEGDRKQPRGCDGKQHEGIAVDLGDPS